MTARTHPDRVGPRSACAHGRRTSRGPEPDRGGARRGGGRAPGRPLRRCHPGGARGTARPRGSRRGGRPARAVRGCRGGRCRAPAPRLRELVEIPTPPLQRLSRLSYSAIALFDRCSYRFYAERIAGMQPGRVGAWGRGETAGCTQRRSAMPRIVCSSASISTAPAVPARDEIATLVGSWYASVDGCARSTA